MDDQPTCGKGLAEHSVLPAKVGELIVALADSLETHMKALDTTDENSRKELDAYRGLANGFRTVGTQLRATAKQMASYRDLPMGRHHMHLMASAEAVEAYERYVRLEQDLFVLLENRWLRNRQMLDAMRQASAAARP